MGPLGVRGLQPADEKGSMFRFVKTQGRTDVSVPYQTYLGGPFAHASSFLAVQGPLAKLQGLYDLQMKTIGGVLRDSLEVRDRNINCRSKKDLRGLARPGREL